MDAEELPEVKALVFKAPAPPLHVAAPRGSSLCRLDASLEVIDLLLSVPGAVQGQDVDALLDLRFLLRHRRDAEGALRLFCEVRRRLEQRHYLAFYRLRRWIEGNIAVEVVPSENAVAIEVPLRLSFFCVEAVRRHSLCAALHGNPASAKPRLSFVFSSSPNRLSATNTDLRDR